MKTKPTITSETLLKRIERSPWSSEISKWDTMIVNIDWVTFLLKLFLVPTFIAIVSLAGRRWGASIGGWLVSLPLTSGPVAFFLALEQGNSFLAQASRSIMLGIVSVYAFSLAYSWLSIRFSWLLSAMGSLAAYFTTTYLLDRANLSEIAGLISVLLALVLSLALLPRGEPGKLSTVSSRWEIPTRMISATALVFVITSVAHLLGPQLTGLLTPFPVYASILAVFTHRSEGGWQAVRLLRGVVVGSFTFRAFFLVIFATILAWGVGYAFMCAIGVGLLTHAVSLQYLKRV